MEIAFIPRWVLVRLYMDDGRRFHLNCALSAVVVLAALPFLSWVPHFCLAQEFLHIPCPGCGITRSIIDLARFEFRKAWDANPAGFLLLFLFSFQLFARPIALIFPRTSGDIGRIGRWISTTTGAALLAVWMARLI
jgi:uncharacterized protein DUF2752